MDDPAQSTVMMSDLLLPLMSKVERQFGLKLKAERWSELKKAVDDTALEYEVRPIHLIHALCQESVNQEMMQALAYRLTIGETHFFRDPAVFKVLEHTILPDLIHRRASSNRSLRIWSAGCSTGEEPYSLAMVLDRLLPDRTSWDLAILGTDLNPNYLRTAVGGRYNEWSFREPMAKKEAAKMTQTQGQYELPAIIRKMVKFSLLNLATSDYPCFTSDTHGMDLIVCRNVLMYFTPEAALACITRFTHCLAEGGWFIVAAAEMPLLSSFSDMERIYFPDSIVFRKTSKARGRAIQSEADPILPTLTQTESDDTPLPLATPETDPSARSLPRFDPVHEAPACILFENLQALYEQGQYAHVVQSVAEHTHAQASPAVYGLAARACANQGQVTQAMRWCERAIALDRTNLEWWHLLACLEQEQGHHQKAIDSFRNVLYLDPDCVVAHLSLGALFTHAGQTKQAQRSYRLALELLDRLYPDRIVPYSEGLSAGALAQLVRKTLAYEDKE